MAASTTPRWQPALRNALETDEKSTVFQLATVDSGIPRVRSHVFRSFLSPKGKPAISLVMTTTDIRTCKITQMAANPRVELAWWVQGTQEQFRIAGNAYIVPERFHPRHFTDEDVRSSIGLAALAAEGFDWEERRKETFDLMSGYMKATWCRPLPGTRLEGGYEEARTWPAKLPKLGEATGKKEECDLEIALGNFALVVIEPDEVDYVELGVTPNQRTRFTIGANGEWIEEAVVP